MGTCLARGVLCQQVHTFKICHTGHQAGVQICEYTNVLLYPADNIIFFFTQTLLPVLPNLVSRPKQKTNKKKPSITFQFSILSLYNEVKY